MNVSRDRGVTKLPNIEPHLATTRNRLLDDN